MAKPYTDLHGVTRVNRIDDLPDESMRCYATAHQWDDPPATEASGWGSFNAVELRSHCPCGRYKYEVIDLDTGDRLGQPQYGGGVMLFPGTDFPKRVARAEWLRRKRLNAARIPTVGGRRRKSRA